MVIISEDYEHHLSDSDHITRKDSLMIRKKSGLGLCSITADDLMTHSMNKRYGKKPSTTEILGSMTGFIQSSAKQYPSSLHKGFTFDFEETLFHASLNPTSSTKLIQMIADIKHNGGRCRLPFHAYCCHGMWVGAVAMETDVIVPLCKKYQVCLLHHDDNDSVDGNNSLLDANGNKKFSVMAGKPILFDCPSTSFIDVARNSGIIRFCRYQSGKLLQGIQMCSSDGQTLASPIRFIFSFTEMDEISNTNPYGMDASTRKPTTKCVYRCSAPIDNESGLTSIGTNNSLRQKMRTDEEHRNVSPPH